MCNSFLTTADFLSSSPAGNFGVMFDIETIAPIEIVGFDIVTTNNANVNYEIFTKRNSFQQYGQTDLMAWHYVAAGVVRGRGPNMISSIPPTKLVPVSIPANTVQGFYFTLHTPELLTHGTALSVGGVFAANDEIEIHVGASVETYPFGASFRSRRAFSGTVQYHRTDSKLCGEITTKMPTVRPTSNPTFQPSKAPTTLPSFPPTNTPTIGLTYLPSNIPSPLPSNVPSPLPSNVTTVLPTITLSPSTPKLPTAINSMLSSTINSILSPSISPTFQKPYAPEQKETSGVQIFAPDQPEEQTSQSAETVVSYTFIVDYPMIWPNRVLQEHLEERLKVAVNHLVLTKAFVNLQSEHNINFYHKEFSFWLDDIDPVECNPNLPKSNCLLFGGSVAIRDISAPLSHDITYAFLQNAHLVTEWIDKDASIAVRYAGNEPVDAEVIITLSGVPRRDMTNVEVQFFQEAITLFLSEAFRVISLSETVEVLSVNVDKQTIVFDEKLGQRKLRSLQGSSASINIVTTITGLHLPPPEIDFPTLVVDSIDSNGAKLIDKLKNGANTDYFGNAKEIEVRLSEPRTPDKSERSCTFEGIEIYPEMFLDPNCPLMYVGIASLLVVAILCMLSIFCIYRIKHTTHRRQYNVTTTSGRYLT